MFIEGQEILDRRYRVVKKLGGGAFGEIYKGNLAFDYFNLYFGYSRKEKDGRVLGSQSSK